MKMLIASACLALLATSAYATDSYDPFHSTPEEAAVANIIRFAMAAKAYPDSPEMNYDVRTSCDTFFTEPAAGKIVCEVYRGTFSADIKPSNAPQDTECLVTSEEKLGDFTIVSRQVCPINGRMAEVTVRIDY